MLLPVRGNAVELDVHEHVTLADSLEKFISNEGNKEGKEGEGKKKRKKENRLRLFGIGGDHRDFSGCPFKFSTL